MNKGSGAFSKMLIKWLKLVCFCFKLPNSRNVLISLNAVVLMRIR